MVRGSLRLPPPLKLTATNNLNIVESGIKHHNHDKHLNQPSLAKSCLCLVVYLFLKLFGFRFFFIIFQKCVQKYLQLALRLRVNKGNNKITELRAILQMESQNS